jgi:hypothetical protein
MVRGVASHALSDFTNAILSDPAPRRADTKGLLPCQLNLTSSPATSRNRPVWTDQGGRSETDRSLKPYPNNVRVHSEKSIARLAEGIAEFGFIMPVVIDVDRTIIAGHGRVEAAKRLGMTTIPTICADHLTPAQVRAYRIADNRLAELSTGTVTRCASSSRT